MQSCWPAGEGATPALEALDGGDDTRSRGRASHSVLENRHDRQASPGSGS